MRITFVDEVGHWQNLLPLTYTKPIAKLRIGILTIQEKWETYLESEASGFLTQPYLQSRFPDTKQPALFINSIALPNQSLVKEVKRLKLGEVLVSGNVWVAFRGDSFNGVEAAIKVLCKGEVVFVYRPWHLYQVNSHEIQRDYKLLTIGRKSKIITDDFTKVYAPSNVFLEDGAEVKAAILNADNGPIYLGKNTKVHEGAIIKGPFALCEDGQVVAGTRIREGCTIGIKATGGGELKNSIIGDYTNKGHDGYLGDSVIGNWCNLGALTNVSNLKNTYSEIKIWDRNKTDWINSGTNKLGCILGDYVHTGISTMLNTGTIIEPFCQLYGAGLHRKFVNSFQWGEPNNYVPYQWDKVIEVAKKIQKTKGMNVSKEEVDILKHVHGSNKF